MIIAPIIRILFKLYQAYQAQQGKGNQPIHGDHQASAAPQADVRTQAASPSELRDSVRSGPRTRAAQRRQQRELRRQAKAWR